MYQANIYLHVIGFI